MKKQVQQQMLALLATIEECLREMDAADPDAAFTALNDSYGGAAAVQEAIQASLPAGRFSFYNTALENFMATLQQANQRLQQGEDFLAETTAALGLLAEVQQALAQEAVIKVAFFPYKASMWDSLESIWKAATADARCEVVVVPIPYYDKNKDGSFAQKYDEGDQFPVPVVDYRQFDLAAWRPDIAYIHNPYDNHNFVTSVEPAFYSTALKKYVGTLVYVPYYANETASATELNMAAAAGAADVVVAATGQDAAAIGKLAPRKSVLLAGSPKIDRVLALNAKKPPLPAGWVDKLTGKKVFLLNTSLQSLLQHEEIYLAKLQDTFTLFSQMPGAALLWRPHPLLRATIASMRPAAAAVYDALRTFFEQSGLGVYDDSADPHVAIALADAYIGDIASSLAYLFSITGKPVYCFDYREKGGSFSVQGDEEALRVQSFYTNHAQDGVGWAFCATRNAFCRYDLHTGAVEDLFGVQEELCAQHLFGSVVRLGEKVVLPPLLGHGFVVADVTQADYRYLPLPQQMALPAVFAGGFACGEKAFFVKQSSGVIACVDSAKGTVVYHDPVQNDLDWHKNIGVTPAFSLFGCVVEDVFYAPVLNGPFVLAFHMKTSQMTCHRLGDGKAGFQDIAFDGEAFWLCQSKRFLGKEEPEALVKWNPLTGETTPYGEFPPDFCPSLENEFDDHTAFSSLAVVNGRVLAFPYTANMAVALEPETGKIAPYPLDLPFDFTQRRSARYHTPMHTSFQHMQKGHLCLWAGYDYGYYLLEKETGKLLCQTRLLAQPKGGLAELSHPQNFYQNFTYLQQPLFALEDFVREVGTGRVPARDPQQAQEKQSLVANGTGGAGQAIHNEMMARQK